MFATMDELRTGLAGYIDCYNHTRRLPCDAGEVNPASDTLNRQKF